MKDRVPKFPGRVTMTPVPGQANTYDMVRADQPVEVGDALNKANLLPDDVAAALALTGNPQVKDALDTLGNWASIRTTHAKVIIGVFSGSGSPCTGAKISGCGDPLPCVMENGYAVTYVTAGTYTIGVDNEVSEYIDALHSSTTITVEAGKIYSVNLPLATELKILASRNVKFSPNVASVDVFCVGGGQGGNGATRSTSGTGGKGGYTNTGLMVAFSPNVSYSAVIGSGGLGAATGTGNSGGSGGTTSLLGVSANGGSSSGGGSGAGQSDGSGGQGTTTRPFGNVSMSPPYAGGGGNAPGGLGGNYGGGNGGTGTVGLDAVSNSGGGGGGGSTYDATGAQSYPWFGGGAGGSGIIIVRWRNKS